MEHQSPLRRGKRPIRQCTLEMRCLLPGNGVNQRPQLLAMGVVATILKTPNRRIAAIALVWFALDQITKYSVLQILGKGIDGCFLSITQPDQVQSG